MDNQNIVTEANKYLPDCDVITNSFDLTLVWLSPYMQQITGYTNDDLQIRADNMPLRNVDVIDRGDKPGEKVKIRENFFERLVKGNGVDEFVVIGKNGSRTSIKFNYKTFDYNNCTYMIAKIFEATPVVK